MIIETYTLKRTGRPGRYLLQRPGGNVETIAVPTLISAVPLIEVTMPQLREWVLIIGRMVRDSEVTAAEYAVLLTAGPSVRTYWILN